MILLSLLSTEAYKNYVEYSKARSQRCSPCAVLVLVLVLLAMSTIGLYAQDPEGRLSPDYPMIYYWFRTERAASGDVVVMDPRLQEVSAAFGTGDFNRARQLAQALLDSPKVTPALSAEAVVYLAESYLAQGEFEKAAQVAKKYNYTVIAAHATSLQQHYQATLSRLDSMRNSVMSDPGGNTLKIARVHRQVGRLSLAQESYWKIITEHPGNPKAVRAASEVVNMHQAYGTPESVQAVCDILVGLDPNGDVAVATCRAIKGPQSAWQKTNPAAIMDLLRNIVERYPRTRASAVSGLNLGNLLLTSGEYEQADEVWTRVVTDNTDAEMSREARYKLADLRYERGMKAFTERRYESAIRWLEPLVLDIEMLTLQTSTERLILTEDIQALQRQAIFSLGEAHEKLGHWQEAVRAFSQLAVRGNPAEEVTRFRLVRCYINMGNHSQAQQAYDELVEWFPKSPYTREAQKLL